VIEKAIVILRDNLLYKNQYGQMDKEGEWSQSIVLSSGPDSYQVHRSREPQSAQRS
jgi:hypothetical protein